MNEANNLEICDRANDLIAFLYGELTEPETRSFERHKRDCVACSSELASFASIRQSIGMWRNRSLGMNPDTSTATSAAPVVQTGRSALAAIRGFLDLSPLWMKTATAFAAVLLCVLAGLAFARMIQKPQPTQQPAAYSAEDFKIAVEKETAARLSELKEKEKQNRQVVEREANAAPRKQQNTIKETQRQTIAIADTPRKIRKPLTRAEREQLAADLRLTSDDDEDSLQLLGDRINR
jgi:hypothetical protein